MAAPNQRRWGRSPAQSGQAAEERQARFRRQPLFPLEADDIRPSARPRPPAPLGELLGDIDSAMPSKALPREPARDPSAPPRRQAFAAPPRSPGTTQPGAAHPARPAPGDQFTEHVALMHAAQQRMEAVNLYEHRLVADGPLGSFGPALPPLPALRMPHWIGLGMFFLASLLLVVAFTSGKEGRSKPVGDYVLRAPPSLTANQIDRILTAYGSPATGTGAVWYNLGLKYGIDPAFAIAFFVHESAAGTAEAWAGQKPDGGTTHNIGNIICAGYAACYGRFRDYASWSEGIEDWYRLIDTEYLRGRDHQTVADIIPVYAPSVENDVQGYIRVVQALVDEWRTRGGP